MGKRWILFVPRPKSEAELTDEAGASLTGVVENWAAQKGEQIIDSIDCLENSHPIDSSFLQAEDVSLYVLGGHCLAGRSYVSWPGKGRHKLEFGEMANRIATLGLDENSKCVVKIYSCQSAQIGKGEDLNEPFAMRVASDLRSRGVKGCKYYGYNFDIRQLYVDDPFLSKCAAEDSPMSSLVKELTPEELAAIRKNELHRWARHSGRVQGRAGRHKAEV